MTPANPLRTKAICVFPNCDFLASNRAQQQRKDEARDAESSTRRGCCRSSSSSNVHHRGRPSRRPPIPCSFPSTHRHMSGGVSTSCWPATNGRSGSDTAKRFPTASGSLVPPRQQSRRRGTDAIEASKKRCPALFCFEEFSCFVLGLSKGLANLRYFVRFR